MVTCGRGGRSCDSQIKGWGRASRTTLERKPVLLTNKEVCKKIELNLWTDIDELRSMEEIRVCVGQPEEDK